MNNQPNPSLTSNVFSSQPVKPKRRLLKYLLLSPLILLAVLLLSLTIFLCTVDFRKPDPSLYTSRPELTTHKDWNSAGESLYRKNRWGLGELYLSGTAAERGMAFGLLTQDEIFLQEQALLEELSLRIPSPFYLRFLQLAQLIFNRNLADHIPEEYRQEIYGLSLYCSDQFNTIGPAYERQLCYHAAHDIGHMLQQYNLVGCTSFGVWGKLSADSKLLIGRNFDFYLGDKFAQNKLITICRPDSGYSYISVGWAGMTGILSGMNSEGLTITLNAAAGPIPISSATPISILARQILQYASTLDEAFSIAQQYQTFVSESLLIGSAQDRRAAIIEKTPLQTVLYDPRKEYILCSNHYQSDELGQTPDNLRALLDSDSLYRFNRLEELILSFSKPLSPNDAAAILRNPLGMNDTPIGLGNPKAINQFIAHHSVIFQPELKRLWIALPPWQAGDYICYDLERILKLLENIKPFSSAAELPEFVQPELTLPADPQLLAVAQTLIQYRQQIASLLLQHQQTHHSPPPEEIKRCIELNPEFYHAYEIAGNLSLPDRPQEAVSYWMKALEKELPTRQDQIRLETKIKQLSSTINY